MTRASRPPRPHLGARGWALLGLVCACANTAAVSSDPVSLPNEEDPRGPLPARTARLVDAAIPALASTAAREGGPRPGVRCGDSPCPLRTWMKTVVAPAVDGPDLAPLAATLDELATLAPSGYPNWASIARDGAEAARSQLPDAVRGACRGCHSQYRERYKRELGIRGL